jgi:hypothetical protein
MGPGAPQMPMPQRPPQQMPMGSPQMGYGAPQRPIGVSTQVGFGNPQMPMGYTPQPAQPIPPQNMPPAPPPPVGGGMRARLSIFYDGSWYVVDKDRYIIGRGKQSSDLVIKDPNVSRQHAMVEYLNGLYYLVDMGSTNGVEIRGERVTRKPVGEGDAFSICGHEVRFTYR